MEVWIDMMEGKKRMEAFWKALIEQLAMDFNGDLTRRALTRILSMSILCIRAKGSVDTVGVLLNG